MENPKCVLCGHSYPTGLHILGCFLCFPCEKALLRPDAVRRLPVVKRRRLAKWAVAEKRMMTSPNA
ncbi:MAG: hypothetical protein IJ461_05370 [Clostridia bacterium]|nr:hypothetical protein [Clostridia bacterium]